ncbi:4-carboxy-4-hydroxy-2-oxoadipate aldolase/oxaloacetate decarboxylase [Microbacterium protaetiae]|uniref:Putative 4-hydroxy-4-methyl-2-oxoglutarate aldolase n=1 Tax=Microbacterium protaetiae TaxID=2509458 RepID=A0A4P6EA60_9MICO|nr:4-carboxy-4-hydroxy-2-oxoadipate aldolase/oxaloacetate decarboxylase [Microbacterium protaetiae]QAY58854.1 4-carboxy-4-hydroxy-2-oxoadipate aldolase/oxaloacetate decarboxylase [Microbacterium protaetiae]
MSPVIVTDIARADAATVDALAVHGVATVHEAMGRTGLVGTGFSGIGLRPIQQDVRVAGTAVTVLSHPGDNLMIHAAVEQCRSGDLLVVATTSPSTDGAFGELFATALHARGVRGLVTTTGVRDTAELRALGFPVWASAVCAQGTVKNTPGSINVPVIVGGVLIRPGDVVVADDDGVLCVPRTDAAQALAASDARFEKEEADRAAYAGGQLSLDRKGLRPTLTDLGIVYMTQQEYDAG